MWVAQLRRILAKIRMCARVHAEHSLFFSLSLSLSLCAYACACACAYVCVCVSARASRAGVSFSFRFPLHVSHRLSRPLSLLSVLPVLSDSLTPSLAAHFFSRICGRRSVAYHEERGRGVESERGRGREKANRS